MGEIFGDEIGQALLNALQNLEVGLFEFTEMAISNQVSNDVISFLFNLCFMRFIMYSAWRCCGKWDAQILFIFKRYGRDSGSGHHNSEWGNVFYEFLLLYWFI